MIKRIWGFIGTGAAAAALGFGLMVAPSTASALVITPATPNCNSGDVMVKPPQDDVFLATYCGVTTGTLQYKQDQGGGESGAFANDYSTEFFNTPTDPEDAKITWNGPGVITCTVCWLVVKDGNNTPMFYGFNLTALGWDGKDILDLQDFWPSNGAISHVSIWSTGGGGDKPLPEPGSLALLGLGLIGLAAAKRRRKG